MFRTLIVPLDGSPLAAQALKYAEVLGRRTESRVIVVSAAPDKGDIPADLAGAVEQLQAAGANASSRPATGKPAAAILEAADSEQADLIVMSTHGRSGIGRWVYGSVAERVLHDARVPVLLVSPGCTRDWSEAREGRRVLVPLDGSEFAEAALEPAKKLAKALDAEIILAEIVDPLSHDYAATSPSLLAFNPQEEVGAAERYLNGIAQRLEGEGFRSSSRTGLSFAPDAIAAMAWNEGADAIVQATHGRGGLARLVLGSTALTTLQRSSVPVVLVRPANLRQEAAPGAVTEDTVTLALSPAELATVEAALKATAETDAAGRSALDKVVAARGGANL